MKMGNTTITIEFREEDRAILHRLAKALEAYKAPTEKEEPTAPKAEPKAEPKEEPKPATTPEQDIDNAVPFDTVPEPVKPEPVEPQPEPMKPDPVKPEITLADIRKLVQTLAQPSTGKNAAVKEIVNHFAPNVSSIPPERYDEVWQLLTALKEA